MKREKGIYRPKLPSSPTTLPKGQRCTHKNHGTEDVCPGCKAIFGKVFWARYSVNGRFIRESTGTTTKKEAQRFLDSRRGSAAKGEAILPSVDRIKYDEAVTDHRLHYQTTGERAFKESEGRLAHLDKFIQGKRLAGIGPADTSGYVPQRQGEGVANGTINRELGVLGRMLRLAYENAKLLRLPMIHKLREGKAREGFFEREQFEAVKKHLRPDLQVAVSIAYAFGWRMQSEVLKLRLDQVDLNACTIRLEPGTTKNDEGRIVYLTPELHSLIQAQVDRVELLSMTMGRPVPYLFPHLRGPHRGKQTQDFRKAWDVACLKAMLEGLEGDERKRRQAELLAGPKTGFLKMLRHDFRRTAVRNMVNAGVPERFAMKITGHKTRAVFDRYHRGIPDAI